MSCLELLYCLQGQRAEMATSNQRGFKVPLSGKKSLQGINIAHRSAILLTYMQVVFEGVTDCRRGESFCVRLGAYGQTQSENQGNQYRNGCESSYVHEDEDVLIRYILRHMQAISH